jgi:26 proteasome complex subunit DSS1
MSSSGSSGAPTTKLQPTQNDSDPAQNAKAATGQGPATLEEDDEVPGGSTHLWEESWDDDDENEDFSKQLR